MAVLIGHLSYEIHFKESRRDKHILSACVWEMNTGFSNDPRLVLEHGTCRQHDCQHSQKPQHLSRALPSTHLQFKILVLCPHL